MAVIRPLPEGGGLFSFHCFVILLVLFLVFRFEMWKCFPKYDSLDCIIDHEVIGIGEEGTQLLLAKVKNAIRQDWYIC